MFYRDVVNSFRSPAPGLLLLALAFADFFPLGAQNETYLVTGVKNISPYSYQDESGAIVGFYPAFLRVAGAELGINFEFVPVDWPEGFQRVSEGKIDLLVGAAKTSERERFLDYNRVPLVSSWSVVLLPINSPVLGIMDLRGRTLGLVEGDQNGKNLQNLLTSFDIDATFRFYPNHKALEQAVAAREVEGGAFFSTYPYSGSAVKASQIIFNPVYSYLASAKGKNARLLERLDALFDRWVPDPSSPYAKIAAQYFGKQVEVRAEIPAWLWSLFILVGGGLVLAVILAFILRRIVALRTKDLRRSTALFRSVFEHSPSPMLISDSGGKIISVNRTFTEFLGTDANALSLLGNFFDEAFDDSETLRKLRQYLTDPAENTKGKKEELPAFETETWIFAAGVAAAGENDRVRKRVRLGLVKTEELFIMVLHDLTELRENQRKLEELNENLESLVQARSLELETSRQALFKAEKNAGLGRMVAGVAHEVNTPLGVALTAASYLRDLSAKLKPSLEEGISKSDFLRFLDQVDTSTDLVSRNLNRVAAIITDFKQLSADQSAYTVRMIYLEDYLKLILENLKPKFHGTSHVCEMRVLNIKCNLRPGALSEVITNLVDNSLIHAFPDKHRGTIRISAGQAGDTVKLRYEDDGIGIPPEYKERLFEPFFSVNRSQGRAGLGLSIVHSLVREKLQGTIRLGEGELGGLCFDLSFPANFSE